MAEVLSFLLGKIVVSAPKRMLAQEVVAELASAQGRRITVRPIVAD